MVSSSALTDAYTRLFLATDYTTIGPRHEVTAREEGPCYTGAPREDPTTSHVPDADNTRNIREALRGDEFIDAFFV